MKESDCINAYECGLSKRCVGCKEYECGNPKCKKCNDTGWYKYDHNHSQVCDACCTHPAGWFPLTGSYYGFIEGADNMCCKAGCGTMKRDIGKETTARSANE